LDLEVLVSGGDDLLEEQWVVVRLLDTGGGDEPVRGEVVEVLGESSTPGVDVLVALRHHGIRDVFPESVLAATGDLPEDPSREDWRGREDLRDRVIVTIDGESARDFDDAVSVECLPGGVFRLGVHIADVAEQVPEGGIVDWEAYRRGTSVYFPDRAVPMLPERLSNGLCSLRPGVPRLTLSVFLDVDREGRVVGRRFAESVIRSHRRLTYDEVRRVLEEPRGGDEEEYGPVLPLLRHLKRLMEILLATRMDRGSVDFDLPEGDVTLDTDGYVVGIAPRRRHVAHRIIEECMIAANEAVAKELLERGGGALFRVHDPPSEEALEDLREVLRTFGIGLRGRLSELPPGELQKVLRRVEGRPEEDFVTTLVLHSTPTSRRPSAATRICWSTAGSRR
jgi:ribonuclease R